MHAFDRQTDGQTDGQTDRNLIVKTALHSKQRGKNYFTVRIRRKCVIILVLKLPPHLKCVATLPCEMSSGHNLYAKFEFS